MMVLGTLLPPCSRTPNKTSEIHERLSSSFSSSSSSSPTDVIGESTDFTDGYQRLPGTIMQYNQVQHSLKPCMRILLCLNNMQVMFSYEDNRAMATVTQVGQYGLDSDW